MRRTTDCHEIGSPGQDVCSTRLQSEKARSHLNVSRGRGLTPTGDESATVDKGSAIR